MSSTAASQAQIKEYIADANLGHFYIESSFLANSAGAIGYPSDGKKPLNLNLTPYIKK